MTTGVVDVFWAALPPLGAFLSPPSFGRTLPVPAAASPLRAQPPLATPVMPMPPLQAVAVAPVPP